MRPAGNDSVELALLLTNFLVLVFVAAVWWVARRDLTARAAESRAPVVAELEQLRTTVQQLTAHLERRAEAALSQIEAAGQSFDQRINDSLDALQALDTALSEARAVEMRLTQASVSLQNQAAVTENRLSDTLRGAQKELETATREAQQRLEEARRELMLPQISDYRLPPEPAFDPLPVRTEPAPGHKDARYAPVYALFDAGMTDAVEIARRTGFGRGEIELLLNLRSLRTH